MVKELQGLHHVTAITSSAPKIYEFYTKILGLRLVKKNVNQDDLTTYHLYFADDRGTAGTAMTFFDFKGIRPNFKGTDEIARTSLRVPNDSALEYWVKRLDTYGVKRGTIMHEFNHKVLYFEDFDSQQYALISGENDTGRVGGEPWKKGPVPDEFAIIGLGPIYLKVSEFEYMDQILRGIMMMRKVGQEGNLHAYEMGQGGNGARVIVDHDTQSNQAMQGYGGVHHVAFRVDDRAHLDAWMQRFDAMGLPNSGFVERYYFKSNYIRLYPNILFELATDGPGFIDDEEDYDHLGESITQPPHLRHKRALIEKNLEPFDTIWQKAVEKEYI